MKETKRYVSDKSLWTSGIFFADKVPNRQQNLILKKSQRLERILGILE